MTLHDTVALAIVLACALAMLLLLRLYRKWRGTDGEWTRKLAHIGTGLLSISLQVADALAAALADADCVLVNRNRGSGTRVLIDQLLGQARPAGFRCVCAKSCIASLLLERNWRGACANCLGTSSRISRGANWSWWRCSMGQSCFWAI